MKRIEFKNIELGSVFKLCGGLSFIAGFIVALFGGGFGGSYFKQQVQTIPYIGPLLTGFFGSVMFGLFSALIFGLLFTFFAVLYNIFATILGGIEIDVNEK
ncbi:MAG: DUF3566 domain-containing protein [Candidatus Omnitrophica bacterium]|nr:DUF3566 domain-containing protein [Candidatus Omnitrophota bacterium]